MYSLLYVDGWGPDEEATGGGRCVECGLTLRGAMQAMADYLSCACRMWGPGLLVVVDEDGARVDVEAEELSALMGGAAA